MTRPRALSGAPARRLVVASLSVLVLTGCSLVGGPGPSRPSSSSSAPSSSPSAKARLVVQDGFTTLSTLPEPIASVEFDEPDILGRSEAPVRHRADLVQLRRQGEVLRAVVAYLHPADDQGGVTRSMARGGDRRELESFEAGWRIYDPAASTVADPLRTEEECLCTRKVSSSATSRSRKVQLFWADLPAPASRRFTLVLGKVFPPMEDLQVPAEAPALPPEGDLLEYARNVPPTTPGQGATAPVVRPVVARSETASGITATTSGEQQELALPSDVLFAVDSDSVEPGAGEGLDRAAASVAAVAENSAVTITGHTDDQGAEGYNQDLSLRRARAVADRVGPVLRAAGISVDVAGKGEGEPLVPNTTDKGDPIPENQARNRRVAFGWTGAPAIAPAAGTTVVRPALPVAVPAPGPAPEGSIASALSTSGYGLSGETLHDGEAPVRLDVLSARREEDRVRVDLTVAATESAASWGGADWRFPAAPRGVFETTAGTSLVDPATGIASFALADDQGKCLCAREFESADVGIDETYRFWVYYPAPPEGVRSVDLQMGSFGRLQGVPLS